jgi:hypothetical protein
MDLEFTSESMPLISFHALVDEDVGIFKFILANYRESSAINMDLLKNKSALQIIGDIYKRKFDNPLKLIMSDEKYSDLLDRCYQELITEHEADIIEHSVTTEFLNLTTAFNNSQEITPIILCYTQEQYDTIASIEALKGIKIIGVKEALSNLNKFTQIYFKFLFEYDLFQEKLENCTVYFSSIGLNFNEDDSDILIDNDKIREMIKKNINVAYFDLYQMKLLGDKN